MFTTIDFRSQQSRESTRIDTARGKIDQKYNNKKTRRIKRVRERKVNIPERHRKEGRGNNWIAEREKKSKSCVDGEARLERQKEVRKASRQQQEENQRMAPPTKETGRDKTQTDGKLLDKQRRGQ